MMESYCRHSFFICLFCCVVLLGESDEVDYWYNACVPRNCGSNNLTIEFPFYIPGKQKPDCGYPGFELNCTQFSPPLLNISGIEYAIKNISYEARTFRVYDAAVESSSCLSGLMNTTLPSQFRFVNERNLHLFYNCSSSSLPDDLVRRGVTCAENGKDRRVLPLYEEDKNFTAASRNCGWNVKVPVEGSNDDYRMITSMNNLKDILRTGFVLDWKASDCLVCKSSGGHCGYNRTNLHFRCFCTDRPHSRSCKPGADDSAESRSEARNSSKLKLAIAIAGGVVVLVLVSVLISVLIWTRKERIRKACAFSGSISKPDLEGGGTYFGIPVFSYTELKVATDNFDSSKELGDGGFGTVYYGKLQDGREVAVKRLYEHNCRRMEQYMNEINILASLRHPNLVSLYGCTSRKSRELLLVYEYISNGTVANHLHGEFAQNSPLSWPVRMKISIETADALAYLHRSDIIHRDVKTDNILLDDNFRVKVADFGLSRLFPNDVTHVSTAPQGTPGYVDPEYHQCYHLTDKSDVYSFGVVLIELISSMPAVDINRHRHEINLANLAVNKIQARAFVELVDASLGYNADPKITKMIVLVAELAFRCLQLERDLRPSMDEVLETLKEIRGSEDEMSFDKKILLSPETEDTILLKKKFQSSPNAVTDVWYSSSSASGSVV